MNEEVRADNGRNCNCNRIFRSERVEEERTYLDVKLLVGLY
jgi:hypothetical protein